MEIQNVRNAAVAVIYDFATALILFSLYMRKN